MQSCSGRHNATKQLDHHNLRGLIAMQFRWSPFESVIHRSQRVWRGIVKRGGLSHLPFLASTFGAAAFLGVEFNLAMFFRAVILGRVIRRTALTSCKQDGIARMPKVAGMAIPARPGIEVIA